MKINWINIVLGVVFWGFAVYDGIKAGYVVDLHCALWIMAALWSWFLTIIMALKDILENQEEIKNELKKNKIWNVNVK